MAGLETFSMGEWGEWVLGDRIGKGGFGSVYKSAPFKYSNGAPIHIAVKVAHPSKAHALLDEARFLFMFQDCPYTINSHGYESTSSSSKLFLEFAFGGTIRDRIDSSELSGLEIKEFTKSVLKGLQCIHDSGYVHCDIKPDNILLVLDEDSPVHFVAKIGDFGLTKSAKNLRYSGGTKRYLPPETHLCGIQDKSSDIWAVGCLVLEMLTGNLWPFKSTDYIGVWASNPIIPSCLSSDAKDFLAKCLVVDANKRSTAKQLLDHPFLVSNQTVEQLPQSSVLVKPQVCNNRLSIESSVWDDFVYPLELMSGRPVRPAVFNTWCRNPTTFAVRGAA